MILPRGLDGVDKERVGEVRLIVPLTGEMAYVEIGGIFWTREGDWPGVADRDARLVREMKQLDIVFRRKGTVSDAWRLLDDERVNELVDVIQAEGRVDESRMYEREMGYQTFLDSPVSLPTRVGVRVGLVTELTDKGSRAVSALKHEWGGGELNDHFGPAGDCE